MTQISANAHWRNFCMKFPRPALIRVICGEESQDLPVADGDVNWARTGETVAALEPDRVELYDAEMMLIRAAKSPIPRAAGAVTMPFAVSNDPQAATFMLFANLLHRAYEHSTQVAFDKIVEIVQYQSTNGQQMNDRMKALEDENLQLRQELIDATADSGEASDGDGAGSIVESFFNGMSTAKVENSKVPS